MHCGPIELTTACSPFVPENPSFDVISATIRLGHKYQMTMLVEHSINYLKLYYNDDFLAFSKRGRLYWPPSFKAEHAIGVINLARLIDAPSLLPLALYHCTFLGTKLMDGWTRDDGTVEHLSDSDLRRCIEARAALVHARTVFLFSMFDGTVSPGCARRKLCAAALRNAQHALVSSEEIALEYHPLRYTWVDAVAVLEDRKKVCGSCAHEVIERAKNGQKNIFDRLPKIFGITVEGWGDQETEAGAMVGDEGE